MNKVYEIVGIVESSRAFKIGNKTFRCMFSGGAVNESGSTPAVFITNDFITQSVIESSKDFAEGIIKLKKVFESDNKNVQVHDDVETKSDFPDVTNSQMAKSILMNEPYNVALAELPNRSAIVNKATELHVTFSNWK